MSAIAFYPSILFHVLFITTTAAAAAATSSLPYTPTEYILLDCGASSNSTSPGCDWRSDANSNYLPPNADTISLASQASDQDPSITQKAPYMTARVFRSQFTYTFSGLSTGPKFIRLYFYPSTYSTIKKQDFFFFSVIANNYYTLLSNFSAFLTVTYPKPASPPTFIKEYIVHINDDPQLNITFLPSPSSYAFVNGIELVSMPANLYKPGNNDQIKFVGQETTRPLYNIPNNTAFETLFRVNVGGQSVEATNDTGMFRAWTPDDDYILYYVSMPDKFYYPGKDVPINPVGQNIGSFYIDNSTAFETMYRLNVGGGQVQVTEDTGMFRAWDQDIDYLPGGAKAVTNRGDFSFEYTLDDAPPYTAPEAVYTAARFMNYNYSSEYNVTWLFPVDSAFNYVVRFHFCVFFPDVTKQYDLLFKIFINNQTAETRADVFQWGHGLHVAVKKDYIAYVAEPDGRRGKPDL